MPMAIVKINVIEVPAAQGPALEERFAARTGDVDKVDGFESFELLRPTDGTDRYLVVTRWRDEAAFEAWRNSDAFQHSHGGGEIQHAHPGADSHVDSEGSGATVGSPGSGSTEHMEVDRDEYGNPGADSTPGHGGSGPDEGHPGSDSRGTVATGSELWSFDVVLSATRSGS